MHEGGGVPGRGAPDVAPSRAGVESARREEIEA
jgi:hypothetical protein